MIFALKTLVATLALLTGSAQARAVANPKPVPQVGQDPNPPIVACSGTGAGTCNLGVVGFITDGNYGYVAWNWITIYNNACQAIGGVHGNVYNEGQKYSIDSQLPYTVDITYLTEQGDYNVIGFKYAGYSFEDHFACHYQDADGATFNVCQHAFPC
ncbi:hypothetical protein TWF694_003200 [Orbilia ellipsospora]|uniref:Uncharacterized protein n=1 Tax=Orbilia ellipsospora TaxID=2528407 RepID=A0AAV9X225_9PEZI